MTTSVSTEQMWAERVRAWRATDESAESFAKGKGFSGSALRMWGGRLAPRSGTPGPLMVALVPRSSTAAATAVGGELIIEVGSARIRVGPGVDRALLVEVLGVLGAAR